MTLTKCKQHISMCSVALGSFQPSVFGSAALTLLAVLNLLVTRRSQCQQRVGVFFSSARFCMKRPSCVSASHWPAGLYRFSVSPRSYGESTLMLCSGSHQKEQVLHIIAGGKLLASSRIYSDLLILSPFCLHCPLHFEFSSTATWAVKRTTSEPQTCMLGRKCITSLL